MGVDMGFCGSLEWVTAYSKKQCRSLFWRMRAAVKKSAKNKQQLKFQYDPSSYALNFDDGCCHLGKRANEFKPAKVQDFPDFRRTAWVYVVWVKAEWSCLNGDRAVSCNVVLFPWLPLFLHLYVSCFWLCFFHLLNKAHSFVVHGNTARMILSFAFNLE